MRRIKADFLSIRLSCIFCVLFVSYTYSVRAQEIVPPLDIPLLLSGNFGELRSNHFHSGIDFKTQQVTGLPVKSVKDGYISRISVSPYGYGRAVYIDHPDGTTSVYGHLERFSPTIEAVVRDSQYRKMSFSVNLLFSSGQLALRKGEVFAFSGNTGGSAGPHLHFEFRDTQTETALDPLPYFRKYIKDVQAPEIRSLMFFPQPGKGIINDHTENQIIAVSQDKTGKKRLAQAVKAWGDIGIGIKAYDRMTGTANIYGVNEITLIIDDAEVYCSVIANFSFEDTRYINSFIDWKEWKEHNSFHIKSFIEPGNKLTIYHALSDGIITLSEEKTYHCKYILKDVFGNTTTLPFEIIGVRQHIPERKPQGILFPYNQDNTFKGKGIDLNIPSGNLYKDAWLSIETAAGYTDFAPLYSLGEQTPLHNYCELTLDIPNDRYPDKSKYGVIAVSGTKIAWIGGKYDAGKLKTRIRELGNFSVAIDTVPPLITPVNPTKWTKNRRISFKISDNLSGIESYKGDLDGNFILFEYDAKTNFLFYEYDSRRMPKEAKTLHLIVKDGAGNQSEFSWDE
jgi:hypothetical protein